MRFRKRIKLIPGVRLNLSKSGVSLSAGVRGASVTFGKRGNYLNVGIPGTGLYDRKRIGSSRMQSQQNRSDYVSIKVSISLDESGKPVIADQNGDLITEESLLRKIKRSNDYKDTVARLSREKAGEIQQETDKFVNIYRYTPSIIPRSQVEKDLSALHFEEYVKREFDTPEPSRDSVRVDLEANARREIRSLPFWTNKKKRAQYVTTHLDKEHRRLLSKWQKEKSVFELKENEYKSSEDKRRSEAFKKAKQEIESKLNGTESFVGSEIEGFLNSISLPVEFSVDYEYKESTGDLLVDLDLPEIEDMPTEKASTLSSGKISVKQKSKKELKEDYARCVTGLAFIFAGNFFNVSPHIQKILLSGYTQRVSKKTGNMEDEYVYSVLFERDKFEGLNIKNVDPIEAFSNFKNILNITSSFDLKTIKPFDGIPDTE